MKLILALSLAVVMSINLGHAGTGIEQSLQPACPSEKDVSTHAKDLIMSNKVHTTGGKFIAVDMATRKPVIYSEDVNSTSNVFKAKQVINPNSYFCVYDIEQTQTTDPNFHKMYRILLQITK